MSECGLCGGLLQLLGFLGTRAHLRCRDCGMDWSEDHPELDGEWFLDEIEEEEYA